MPHVEAVLGSFEVALGEDFEAYRNHVLRVCHLAAAFAQPAPEELERIQIAAAFHDLGIWSHATFDYLEPSAALARGYLEEIGRPTWRLEVELMIHQHHKITACQARGSRPGMDLEEAFRRADWVDVTLGRRRFGLSRGRIRPIVRAFPNAGFHRRLRQLTWGQLRRRPWNPFPMFKW